MLPPSTWIQNIKLNSIHVKYPYLNNLNLLNPIISPTTAGRMCMAFVIYNLNDLMEIKFVKGDAQTNVIRATVNAGHLVNYRHNSQVNLLHITLNRRSYWFFIQKSLRFNSVKLFPIVELKKSQGLYTEIWLKNITFPSCCRRLPLILQKLIHLMKDQTREESYSFMTDIESPRQRPKIQFYLKKWNFNHFVQNTEITRNSMNAHCFK